MVARKNPVQPTNCDKRLRKYDTSVQVRRTGVSARRRNPPAAGVMRRSAPHAAVAGAACRDARRRCARTRSSRVCATPHRSPRGSPLRGPRARGRAHGPPFDCRILVAGHLPFFAGCGAEAAVRACRNSADAFAGDRDDRGDARPARSRHPLPLVPRAHEKKPRRHFHRRGQPMSEKFHGGDGNDHIGRPAASQPSISAIQLRRARSHASGRRAYR